MIMFLGLFYFPIINAFPTIIPSSKPLSISKIMSFGNTVQNVGNFAQDLPSSENVLHEDIFVPPFYQWVPELGPRPLVLDIQCRKGHFTHEMAEWLKCGNPDIQMVGIDSDYQNVQFARCKYPDLSFHQGYFLQDHYPSGSQLWQSVSYQCFCFQHCLDSFTNDEILFFWDKIHLYR